MVTYTIEWRIKSADSGGWLKYPYLMLNGHPQDELDAIRTAEMLCDDWNTAHNYYEFRVRKTTYTDEIIAIGVG